MATIQKEAYFIISILAPIHRSILQKFFPSSWPKTPTDLLFNRTKLKDSSVPRHYTMSTDKCYWPFKKPVASSSRSVSMALHHRHFYSAAKLLWKHQIWLGQNTIHTQCTKQYSPAAHDVASRGEFFAESDRFPGACPFSMLRTCPATKIIFHLDTVLDLLLLFSFVSIIPINTSLTRLQLSNIQQWMVLRNVMSIKSIIKVLLGQNKFL